MNMKMKIDINKEFITEIEENSENKFLDDIGNDIISKIKPLIPVRTGNLYNQTDYDVMNGNLEIYSHTDYAQHVNNVIDYMHPAEDADFVDMLADKIRGMTE